MPNRCLYIATIKEFMVEKCLAVLGSPHNNYHGDALQQLMRFGWYETKL